jgi:hypothetical protein
MRVVDDDSTDTDKNVNCGVGIQKEIYKDMLKPL